jgi:uncharacterized LabA/DUF88 family protein
MDTIVYVDGFNLYYGALKGTAFKWLDITKMCRTLLPNHNILRVKYYTARVSARPEDPLQPLRQQTLLRALRTTPGLEIIYGRFLQSNRWARLVTPLGDGTTTVLVVKTEEKGSDVNLATHLIHDGHLGQYEAAVIVSNDTDLIEPVRIARYELGKTVGMLNPHKRPSRELMKQMHFVKNIRAGVLASCQFPDILTDAEGQFMKPDSW